VPGILSGVEQDGSVETRLYFHYQFAGLVGFEIMRPEAKVPAVLGQNFLGQINNDV
jgi:hypothetical protein